MGGAFAFMGGMAGFCLRAWHLQRGESQRRQATLKILQEFMVTLVHYIRNADQSSAALAAISRSTWTTRNGCVN